MPYLPVPRPWARALGPHAGAGAVGAADPPPEGLARVDPATGRFLALNTSTPGSIGAPAYGAGALWVTDLESGGEFLIRPNPRTLAVTGQLKVASGSCPAGVVSGPGSHIALAGELVWADGTAW